MSARALHLCCVLLVMFSGFTLASQNCSTSVYQTYDDLNACLTSVPYNETVKTSTLATLRAIIPSYVFVDSVQNSPDPVHIPISVNLQSGLDQIETTDYTTDVALQEAFATLFTQLEDAHTRYTKPIDPYCKSSFVLPFTFYSRVNGTHQNIYLKIRQELLDRYIELYPPFSSTNIDGYQVISLDGEDPVSAIGTFANTSVGYSKDYSARFNLAIDGYGRDFPPMYTWRNQSLQSIPSSATITLDVMDTQGTTTSLQVYWMGVFDEYYPINITDVGQVGVHQLQYFEKILGLDLSRDNEEPEGDPDVYYTMVDENTGVLRIYTFEPKDSGEFIATVEEAVCFFKNQSISRLIIDVSQNGGGSICLGYAVEKFLFPDLEPATGAYDIKASDLFIEFATEAASQICSNVTHQLCGVNPEAVGYFTPCAWFDWYSKDMYYDDTWFIPGKTVTRGGIPGQYSSFITQGCETEFSRWIPGAATKLDLSAGNVIIVSDGLCGSTCSVFARHIQLNNRAKSITTGGVLGTQQPSLTSFPGGEVVHLSYIQELAKRYGLLDSPLVPPPLPTTADFRFAIREIFGWDDILDSSVPQEFTYVPANWQVFYEQPFENRTAVWNSVLPYFDKCDQSLNPPCHVPNGVGKLRCENETTSDTTCITVACNPGYELTINGTCEKCPIGYYSAGISGAACKLCPTLIPENCKFSEDGVTSPVCPFICSNCESCAAYETDANPTLNTVCMETWAFCLLLVAVIIISASTSGVLSSFLTVRYYGRQAAARHFYD